MRERERGYCLSRVLSNLWTEVGWKNCWKELSRIEDNRKNREGKERKKRK